MQLDSLYTNQLNSASLFEVQPARERQTKGSDSSFIDTRDTVSISEEARSLANQLWKQQTEAYEQAAKEEGEDSKGTDDAGDPKNQDGLSLKGLFRSFLRPAYGVQLGGERDEEAESATNDEEEKIDDEIERLRQEMEKIYASDLPEEAKEAATDGIQERIEALLAQKTMMKQAKAQAAMGGGGQTSA
jgi:hypothetical protein